MLASGNWRMMALAGKKCLFPRTHVVAPSHLTCGVLPRKHPGINPAPGKQRIFDSAAFP